MNNYHALLCKNNKFQLCALSLEITYYNGPKWLEYVQGIAEQLDSLRHRIRGLIILGEISRLKGNNSAARIVFNEASMLAQSADRSTIWRTHAALASLLQASMSQVAEIHRRMAAEMMTTILTGIQDVDLHATFCNAEPVQAVLDHDAYAQR